MKKMKQRALSQQQLHKEEDLLCPLTIFGWKQNWQDIFKEKSFYPSYYTLMVDTIVTM